jgi:hypothetical protein
MTKPRKVLLSVLALMCFVLIVAVQFTVGWRPFIGPRMRQTTDKQFQVTPGRLARGRYLTRGLS